jgi:hypothetical protein
MSGGSLGESCNLKALLLLGWDVIVVVQSIPALYAPTAYSNRANQALANHGAGMGKLIQYLGIIAR